MPNIGPVELIIILVIALLILGPGKLPDVGAAIGKSIREFRKATTDVQDTVSAATTGAPAAPVTQAPVAQAPAPAPLAPAAPPPAPAAVVPATAEPVAAAPVPNTLSEPPAVPNTITAPAPTADAPNPPQA
jgi:TatA/E family protein of Tat protein translocase